MDMSLREQGLERPDSNTLHTHDGSVDFRGRPSVRAKSGRWKACPFILGNECCERLAYYGISTNLVTYLIKILHQGSAKAATNVTNWSGTVYITPLIGAFIADSYWGRYRTIAVFSFVYFLFATFMVMFVSRGMVLLTLASALPQLKPPLCIAGSGPCEHASTTQIGVFYFALYLIALGTGGIKPCVSSFGADQFDETDPVEMKMKSSFFNWFYFSINIGALISSTVLVYIQENVSWSWGFGIPAAAMGIAICSFFSGTLLYRYQKPSGSPITRIIQVFIASFRKWRVAPPLDSNLLYETKESSIEGSRKLQHTIKFPFIDKAAIVTEADRNLMSPWRLCTVTQVEEVKSLIRIMPIWATAIVFSTVYGQMSSLFVEQGSAMDVSMGPFFDIPPASLSVFDTISVILCVPVYDRLIVPVVRRYTGNKGGFTQLQRMGIGLFISILAMVAAAVVEIKRLEIARRYGLDDPNLDTSPSVPMSIFWQVPQYFLIGAAEVFTFIGQLEFFYDQSPDAMRSLCSALSLSTVALGMYLSSLLIAIVTRVTGRPGWIPNNLNAGHIDYFFWLLAIISLLNLFVYLLCARWYTYKAVDDTDVGTQSKDKGQD